MNERDHYINVARFQYRRFGLINTSVITRLSGMGVDVPSLERSFEEELNG